MILTQQSVTNHTDSVKYGMINWVCDASKTQQIVGCCKYFQNIQIFNNLNNLTQNYEKILKYPYQIQQLIQSLLSIVIEILLQWRLLNLQDDSQILI
ncbi:hypothetical protein pb186bvf_019819 [Paramecium bursaria]